MCSGAPLILSLETQPDTDSHLRIILSQPTLANHLESRETCLTGETPERVGMAGQTKPLSFLHAHVPLRMPSPPGELLPRPLRLPAPQATPDHGLPAWAQDSMDLPQSRGSVLPEEERPATDDDVHRPSRKRNALCCSDQRDNPVKQAALCRLSERGSKRLLIWVQQNHHPFVTSSQGQSEPAGSTAHVHPNTVLPGGIIHDIGCYSRIVIGQGRAATKAPAFAHRVPFLLL